MKKLINEVDVKNKKVIIRCDLSVTIKDEKIKDDTKIVKSLETINYLLDSGAAVIIMSHLGRVLSEADFKTNSLKLVGKKLSELLNKEVKFCSETHGIKLDTMCRELNPGEVLLMENTRFEDVPNKLESNCSDELSKYWASLGEIFVNDAFASSHRAHASVCGIASHLPAYNGFLMKEEINNLNKVIESPKRPFTVIMGGAKVDDKIDLIKSLIEKCDNLIVGGGIANTFLLASGYNVGASLVSKEMLDEVKSLNAEYKDKIIMPIDVIVGKENSNFREERILSEIASSEMIFDIGKNSIEKFKDIISSSKTIFINGTVGLYENPLFEIGTKEVLKACSTSDATIVTAGGDSLSATNKYGYQDKFIISTGGGAALEYLAYKDLPGIVK